MAFVGPGLDLTSPSRGPRRRSPLVHRMAMATTQRPALTGRVPDCRLRDAKLGGHQARRLVHHTKVPGATRELLSNHSVCFTCSCSASFYPSSPFFFALLSFIARDSSPSFPPPSLFTFAWQYKDGSPSSVTLPLVSLFWTKSFSPTPRAVSSALCRTASPFVLS